MYVVRIISLILGGTFPCARILKKVARVVGLTYGVSDLRLDLLYDAMSLMKMSSESSSLPGAFARLRLEMMSVIWCGDICIFFLFHIEPLVILSRCDRFKFKEGGLRFRSMSMLSSSITATGRLFVNLALPDLKLLLSHAT